MSGSKQIWRPVPGYVNRYDVSNWGRVRSVGRWVRNHDSSWRWIPPQNMRPALASGIAVVKLVKNRNQRSISLARLVMQVFKGHPRDRRVHIVDGNPKNCALSNLRYR